MNGNPERPNPDQSAAQPEIPPQQPPPQPEATPQPRDETPFHENVIDTALARTERPQQPAQGLERERTVDKLAEVRALVETVMTGEYEQSERGRRLRERYGTGLLGHWRALMSGEADAQVGALQSELVYNPATGQYDYSLGRELARRAIRVGWRTLLTGGAMLAVGALTGGTALIPMALLGAGVGRAAGEAVAAFRGAQRQGQEDLGIARVRQYEKLHALAEQTQAAMGAVDNAPPETQEEAQLQLIQTREDAIQDFINFMDDSEQQRVRFRYDEHGQVIVEPGAGLTTTGTEVYQSSDLARGGGAPGRTIEQLEKEAEHARRIDEFIIEGLGAVGGIAGGTIAAAALKGRLSEQMLHSLNRGESVPLDIDMDGVRHGVKMAGDLTRGVVDSAVFHYNGLMESAHAAAQGAQVVMGPGAGQFGSHLLPTTATELLNAIGREAGRQTFMAAIAPAAGLAANAAWNVYRSEALHGATERGLEQTKQEQEIERLRLQPDEPLALYRQEARRLGFENIFPTQGQEWVRRVVGAGAREGEMRLQVLSVFQDGRALVRISNTLDPTAQATEQLIPIPEIWQNFSLVPTGTEVYGPAPRGAGKETRKEREQETKEMEWWGRVEKLGWHPEYKIGEKVWRVVNADRDPATGALAAELSSLDGKDKQVIPVADLLDPGKATLVSFGKPEKKPPKEAGKKDEKEAETRKEKVSAHKELTEDEIKSAIADFEDVKKKEDKKKIYEIRDRLAARGIFEKDPQNPKKYIVTKKEYNPILKAMLEAFGRTK